MSSRKGRVVVALMGLLVLSGCETSTKLGDLFHSKTDDQPTAALAEAPPGAAQPPASDADTTGSIDSDKTDAGLLGGDPNDDLNLGKKQYGAGNFGLAERYFRRAAELHPRDAEAWVGLAAAYDRLRRFDLADRAYDQALAIIGPTAELLNNRGYSYMLRGDYKRARATLLAAAAKDPKNQYVKNNLDLLEKSFRAGKAVQ
ncbi:MAG TPA: tetratricopeptide repeat protein [Xanthobacteraceae bacterium]|nr:tetratricopeptide repeat protein [Xanthobacteraceae bacterium]